MASRLTDFGRRLFSPLAVAVLVLSFATSAANAAFFNLIRTQLVRADLRVASFVLDKSEASTGETVTATVNVSNDGTINATSTQLTLWAANGTTSSRIATVPLGTLSPQARLTHVSTFAVPTSIPTGTHQIFAGVETLAYEWPRDNNTGATTLTVFAEGPPPPPPPVVPPPVVPPPEESVCDYFASPNGTGTGLSSHSPFKIENFWALATPGRTLCLLDGTYEGADHMIDPPTGLSGTSIAPITIRALNDGGVTIDGEHVRAPVSLNGNKWWVLEGFNAKRGVHAPIGLNNGADNNILRRIVAWDSVTCRNSLVLSVIASHNNLFEDVAAFGVGRKAFTPFHSNNNILRRVFLRFDGGINGHNKMSGGIAYNSLGTIFENVIATYGSESMPERYEWMATNQCTPQPVTPQYFTDFLVAAPKGLITMDRNDTVSKCANARMLGSLAYITSTDRLTASAPRMVHFHGLSCVHIRHSMVFVSPSNPSFNHANLEGFRLQRDPHSGGVPMTDLIADHITSVRGSAGDTFHADWAVTNLSAGTSLAAVANPWTNPLTSPGANLCHRYVNGVRTTEPLWPWPMNQRIKDATASAGNYFASGVQATGCDAARGNCAGTLGAPRPAIDVTATVETLLGTIPRPCRR